MLQQARAAAAGLDTAGYVSGYRGSPLGGLDRALADARPFLDAHAVRFQPGVNEELAATAVWGTQQLHLIPGARRDGIFAMWYGKGPGVDRCADVFKHANYAGTAAHGGVLVIAGDDHAARSSALAHQSEHLFASCGIPVLAPAGVQEYLDFGLHGWAMSRYSGCWVAMKTPTDTVESAASVEIDAQRVVVRTPADFVLPPDGVHLRWPDTAPAQERRMQAFKVYAALAYARANALDRLVYDAPHPRLGIIACGKAWLDTCEALAALGIDARVAADIGVRLYKVGMPWPLEADGVRRFAEGLEEILVVEEKRQVIEYQLKEQLYNWREDVRPRVVGKFDERGEWPAPHGEWLLPPTGELAPARVARAIAARLLRLADGERLRERLNLDAVLAGAHRDAGGSSGHIVSLDAAPAPPLRPSPAAASGLPATAPSAPSFAVASATAAAPLQRTPWFCPGCPHNRSTRVPDGACALGGVGCHLMAVWMGRNTLTISQMGGEGASWLGMAEHAGVAHVFANMGDGTYYHSGLLAIRAAVAAGVNITYKILYNDAVAMTGGQPVDGPLTVPQLTRQLAAEGVGRIVVLADDLAKYPRGAAFAPGVVLRPREALDAVQRELQATPGVTVLVYDQTCAAEKRRRRKRGALAAPARRVFIHAALCDGCGECAARSNCLAVVPVDTPFGRKRAIDQTACNFDYGCVDAFCPAIVTVEPGRSQGRSVADIGGPAGGGVICSVEANGPEEPRLPRLDAPYGIVIAGVGGTGVVTVGALIGMAAHLDGKGVTVLDVAGLAQKGGAVMSFVRLAACQGALHAPRIAEGAADLLLGCDLVVAAGDEALSRLRASGARALVNVAQTITGEFLRDRDRVFPLDALKSRIIAALAGDAVTFVDAAHAVEARLGDTTTANIFLLGHAWQQGLVPVSREALLRAIALNGVAVEANHRAFELGRRAAGAAERDEGAGRAGTRAAGSDNGEPRTGAVGERTSGNRASERATSGNAAAGTAGSGNAATATAAPQSFSALVAARCAALAASHGDARVRRYVALVERVCRAEHAALPGSTRLAEAVACAWFRLLATKDEYEVARQLTDPVFERALAERFGTDCRVHFHLAPPLLRHADAVTGEARKRRFGPWLRPLLRALAALRRLRDTPFDPFAHTADNRLAAALADDYAATVTKLCARLRADTLDLAVEIAALPERIRGFGAVRERDARTARIRQRELLAAFEELACPARQDAMMTPEAGTGIVARPDAIADSRTDAG
jgi:indolepyruvate ferredoxin oxidoreductase